MAISAQANTPATKGFSVNATSADASGAEEVVAAIAGKSIYLKQLSITCVSAITVTIGEGETASAVTTVLYGAVPFVATAPGQVSEIFTPPIKLTAATALVVDASGAGVIHVYAQGYYK